MAAHRLNHLEVELTTGERALAETLIERIGQLHERRIAPLLDRIFTDLSPPGQVDRIDTLELDLGHLPEADFDDNFLRALELAIRSAVSRALGDRPTTRRTDIARELLTIFAHTGNLPWWSEGPAPTLAVSSTTSAPLATSPALASSASSAAPASYAAPATSPPLASSASASLATSTSATDPVAAALATLTREAPRDLLSLLRELADDPFALARLTRHCDDTTLAALLAHRWPTTGADLLAAARWLAHPPIDPAPTSWRPPLLTVLAHDLDPTSALHTLLSDLARTLQTSEQTLLPRLARAALAHDAPALLRAHLSALTGPREHARQDMPPETSHSAPRSPTAPRAPSADETTPAPVPRDTLDTHAPTAPTADPVPATDFAASTAALAALAAPTAAPDPTASRADPTAGRADPAAALADFPDPTTDLAAPTARTSPDPHDPSASPPESTDRPHDTARARESLAAALRSAANTTPPRTSEPTPSTSDDSATATDRPLAPNAPLHDDPTSASTRDPTSTDGAPLDPASASRRTPNAPLDDGPPRDPPPLATLPPDPRASATPHPPDEAPHPPDAPHAPHAPPNPTAAPAISSRPPSPSRPAPHLQAARRRALAQLDELHIDDAGLVILWPFLARLFERVALLDDQRAFSDAPSQSRAVALLAYLARQDPDPPEFLLPLPKLLCGLAPEAPHEFSAPLAPEHLAECEHLLAAAIDHAPVLRDMSIPGFRATFLRRRGVLAVRDGAWLLRIERAPYDLVLDRFPWSWSWLKLPWMPDPLRVEW